MLKDIYSPLEIDDQWDQRAPSHEDKVEGGNPVAMDSAEAIPREDPSGGVAVMEQPPVPDMPVPADAGVQPQTTPEAPAEVAGVQTIETPSGGGSITNIGQLTVPAATEVAPTDSTSPETSTDQAPVSSMEGTSTEPTGTETPEQDDDEKAAESMLNPQSQREHDVPASPYGMPTTELGGDGESEGPVSAESDTSAEILSTPVRPEEIYEPDEEHQASSNPESEEGPSEDDAIRTIVEKPLTGDEKEEVASDMDQMPVSPGSSDNETHAQEVEDNKKTRAQETLNGMIEAIDSELKKLADKLKDYQEKQTKIESDIEATQAKIDAKNAEKDDFVASVTALNVRSSSASAPDNDLEQAA